MIATRVRSSRVPACPVRPGWMRSLHLEEAVGSDSGACGKGAANPPDWRIGCAQDHRIVIDSWSSAVPGPPPRQRWTPACHVVHVEGADWTFPETGFVKAKMAAIRIDGSGIRTGPVRHWWMRCFHMTGVVRSDSFVLPGGENSSMDRGNIFAQACRKLPDAGRFDCRVSPLRRQARRSRAAADRTGAHSASLRGGERIPPNRKFAFAADQMIAIDPRGFSRPAAQQGWRRSLTGAQGCRASEKMFCRPTGCGKPCDHRHGRHCDRAVRCRLRHLNLRCCTCRRGELPIYPGPDHNRGNPQVPDRRMID